MMRVVFWGTRGSLPVALTAAELRAKIIAALTAARGRDLPDAAAVATFVDSLPFATAGTFGGHSSCVEIVGGGAEHIVCDLGSGVRPLGQSKMATYGAARPQLYHVFLSHLHWDHLMGFPFFAPAYIPGNRIVIHGCHAEMEEAVRLQFAQPCFPVGFEALGATIEFDTLLPDQPRQIAGFNVTPKRQLHGGDSYGYRFERFGKAVVYSTDSEHKLEDVTERQGFVEFFRGADLVVFDAMYSLAEAASVKADWGHSSNVVGVELSLAAGVRRLALFHHEPIHDDARLQKLLAETRRFEEITREDRRPLEVLSAYDGLTVEL
ncbi:MAG: MBL fold metallo-hydrolase [Dechloromonas sp.]|jgi:phosphoribosyl 1,2-cyclic phosphodiesterase|nr:MBL fold metallo-hydrolase [Dechloromonas sp.]